jgi:hypothetical protein
MPIQKPLDHINTISKKNSPRVHKIPPNISLSKKLNTDLRGVTYGHRTSLDKKTLAAPTGLMEQEQTSGLFADSSFMRPMNIEESMNVTVESYPDMNVSTDRANEKAGFKTIEVSAESHPRAMP